MGLFDKKYCDICGEKIGFLGNRKLEDGNLCKNCAAKLSPFFSERRHSTLADIREQLDYREANKADVAAFHVTRTIGSYTKVLLDEDAGNFVITDDGAHWRDANPDVIRFDQVTGCSMDVNEYKNELRTTDREGNSVSYNPPRFEYSYDFYMKVDVNSPWFDEIKFKINGSMITNRGSADYREAENEGQEIKEALTKVREGVRSTIEAAKAPKAAVTCPHCGATTVPDVNGCCEFCGGAITG
jgi:hypothetical protein